MDWAVVWTLCSFLVVTSGYFDESFIYTQTLEYPDLVDTATVSKFATQACTGNVVFTGTNSYNTSDLTCTTTSLAASASIVVNTSGTTVTITAGPPWYVIMDGSSLLYFGNGTTLVLPVTGQFIGSGTLEIDSGGAWNVSAFVTVGTPSEVLSSATLQALSSLTFTRPLYLQGTMTIASGATVTINQPISWYPTGFDTGAVVNGSGQLTFLSGQTVVNNAAVSVPVSMNGASATNRRYSNAILTSGTINPYVALCATPSFGSSSISVASGAGFITNTSCRVTSGLFAAATSSAPVTISSGGWLGFDRVTPTAAPLVLYGGLTMVAGSQYVVLVNTTGNTGTWMAPLLWISTINAACPTNLTSATLLNCETIGCSLLSSSNASGCLLYLSHGLNYNSSTYTMVSLIPCSSMTPAAFVSVVASTVPSSSPYLQTPTVTCGSSIISFYCTASSTALANTYCQNILNSASLQSAIAYAPTTSSGSNGGLYALLGLLALPLLLLLGCLCLLLGPRMRRMQIQKASAGRSYGAPATYPSLREEEPLPPVGAPTPAPSYDMHGRTPARGATPTGPPAPMHHPLLRSEGAPSPPQSNAGQSPLGSPR